MTIYTKGFRVTSSDAGAEVVSLISTTEETKKALRICYTDVITNPVVLWVNIEREKIVDDVPLEVIADATPERIIQLDATIPVGQQLRAYVKPLTLGSQGTIVGFLEYEIV